MILKYNRPNIHYAYGIRLIPGINNVDEKLWAIAANDSEIKRFVEKGIIEVVTPDQNAAKAPPKDPLAGLSEEEKAKLEEKAFGDNKDGVKKNAAPPELPPVTPLGSFNEKKALAMIAETYDAKILKEWQDSEQRSKVKRAIEDQIKKLEAPAPTNKKEEE